MKVFFNIVIIEYYPIAFWVTTLIRAKQTRCDLLNPSLVEVTHHSFVEVKKVYLQKGMFNKSITFKAPLRDQ